MQKYNLKARLQIDSDAWRWHHKNEQTNDILDSWRAESLRSCCPCILLWLDPACLASLRHLSVACRPWLLPSPASGNTCHPQVWPSFLNPCGEGEDSALLEPHSLMEVLAFWISVDHAVHRRTEDWVVGIQS